MLDKSIIHLPLSSVSKSSTSHGVGTKRVLCSQVIFPSPVTQLAVTDLKAGDQSEVHTHLTMDEHFIILEGKCEMMVDGEAYHCGKDTYLLVPAGCEHSVTAITNAKMITIGIKSI